MSKPLSQLPVGALIRDPLSKYFGEPIVWKVMEHNHAGDPSGTTALVTEGIIGMMPFDAKETGNTQGSRASYGNCCYSVSNILQWLNSEASSNWYTAKHSKDAPPSAANVWESGGVKVNPYDTKPGFMTNLSSGFKAALQEVSKITAKHSLDGGGQETVKSKMFLLSNTEVGLANENNVAEGSKYACFSNDTSRIAKVTASCVANSNYPSNPQANAAWYYWLRSPYYSNSTGNDVRLVDHSGALGSNSAYIGHRGLRPACCLLTALLKVSDTPDSQGVYDIKWNAAPEVHTATDDLGDINSAFSVKFSMTDEEGDPMSAEVKLDSTTKQTIGSVVSGREYTQDISLSEVRALSDGPHILHIIVNDDQGNTTDYEIRFNKTTNPIAISGEDGDIGSFWATAPVYKYKIEDNNPGITSVKVIESIDDEVTKTINTAALDVDHTFDLSSFAELESGQLHTLKIAVSDANGSQHQRVVTFTKLLDELVFYTEPQATDVAAEKILAVVQYDQTGNPEIKIEASNDMFAPQQHWEDITEDYKKGELHIFENKPTSGFGVSIKVTIKKNARTPKVTCTAVGFSFA